MSIRRFIAPISFIALAACSGSSNLVPRINDAGTADLRWTFGPDDDMAMNSIDPGSVDLVVNDDCPDNAKLVYVVDADNRFSSFKPDMLKFVEIGVLNCPAEQGASPFSMSVDRDANAWVLYSSGEVFLVDTKTLACKPSGFQQGQQGFGNFGMGFSADMPGSAEEHLFVSDNSGFGFGGGQLGRVDPKTLKLSVIGPINGSPELTGTGDARLWAFFPDQATPRVSELDKVKGTESNTYQLGATISGTPLAWAFAFWGGDFWIFLKRDVDSSTIVWRLRANGKLIKAIPDTGRTIVGAGVSTCAPIMIQ